MFCTGGIRCEKASAHLLKQGFENVYHLQGGILNYLQQTTADDSLWEGECFVFDHRVSVTHGLKEGDRVCFGCRWPLKPRTWIRRNTRKASVARAVPPISAIPSAPAAANANASNPSRAPAAANILGNNLRRRMRAVNPAGV